MIPLTKTLALWWRAVRPYAYPASIVPAALGTAAAWSDGYRINFLYALLGTFGVIAAHTGANLINDYEDFRRGVDREGVLGGSGMLVEGILSPKSILVASLAFFALALLAGLPLIMKIGLPLLVLAVAGFIAGAGYGLPPLSLKYRAMGEPTVFLAFGAGITLGTYMVQSRVFSWAPIAYSIPIGLLVVALLFANNIRDVEDDRAAGVTTLPGYLGKAFSSWIFALLVNGYHIRRAAADTGVALITNLQLARRLVESLTRKSLSDLSCKSWQEYQ